MEEQKHHKRNFKTALVDFYGQPIFNPLFMDQNIFSRVSAVVSPEARKEIADALTKLRARPLTVFEVVCEALRYQAPGEEISAAERQQRFNLMMRLRLGMVKLSDQDRDIAKDAVMQYWRDNLISGQVSELLEGREFKPKLEPDVEADEQAT